MLPQDVQLMLTDAHLMLLLLMDAQLMLLDAQYAAYVHQCVNKANSVQQSWSWD